MPQPSMDAPTHLARSDRETRYESCSVDALLDAMRAGDRDAAAEFMRRYGSRIRRRVRGKLGPGMRRLFDSQDILSTVGRRLDEYVGSSRVEASNLSQVMALVLRIANNAVVDKARVVRRLERVESEDAPFAQQMRQRLEEADRDVPAGGEIELARAFESAGDPESRHILWLWLRGCDHGAIARELDVSRDVIRKRWQKIRERLRAEFEEEKDA